MNRIVEFLFEVGMLKRTPRSGWQFLGTNCESVAEHSFRTAVIALVLARFDDTLDADRMLRMALLHDLPEARTGDLNYMNQKYVRVDEQSAAADMAEGLPVGDEILDLLAEYRDQATAEAVVVRDADNLEMLFELKEQLDTGNPQASDWIPAVIGRLKTEGARAVAAQVMETNTADWWFDRSSPWWLQGGKGKG